MTTEPTTPTIRPATTTDLGSLHALIERAYRGEESRRGWTHEADYIEGPRTDRETLSAIIADPRQVILVALDETGVVGCVQIADQGGGTAYLGLLSVEPTGQASGLGRALLAAGEAEARVRFGAQRIEMTVVDIRETLIAYYQRRGYVVTGESRPFDYPGVLDGRTLAFAVLEKHLKA